VRARALAGTNGFDEMRKKTWIIVIFIVDLLILGFSCYVSFKEQSTYALAIALITFLGAIKLILEILKPSGIKQELREVIAEELDKRIEPTGASSWVDGIPQTKNINLATLFAKGLKYKKNFEYDKAIKAFIGALGLKDIKESETGVLHLQIGNSFYGQSKLEEALGSYKQALSFAERAKDDEGKAAASGNIGLIYQDKGDLHEALKYHQEALRIDKEIGYREGEAKHLGNMGLIYQDRGDLDQALKYLQDALKIQKETGLRQYEANQLGNIGNVYHLKGDLDRALKYHEEALKIHKDIGFREGEASDLGNIGLMYQAKGDPDQALKYHQDALKIHKEIGFREGEANQLGNIGNVYYLKGDLDQALKYLKEALKIFEEIGMRPEVEQILRNLKMVEEKKKGRKK